MLRGFGKSAFLILMATFVGGCSSLSSYEREAVCVAVGATAGGVGGGMNDGDDAVKGAIGGALVGALVCHLMDGDADQDGVKDSADQCPGTPIGKTVDSKGCSVYKEVAVVAQPEPVKVQKVGDSDLDGVFDDKDLCPNTPAGTKVDKQGCPQVQKIVLNDVTFEFDSATLTSQANQVLLKQAKILAKNPATKISITGHTDAQGAEKYNQILSLKRARAVRNFFVDQGINSSIVTVSGAGELEPIAENLTEVGRATNRRVELKVIRKGS